MNCDQVTLAGQMKNGGIDASNMEQKASTAMCTKRRSHAQLQRVGVSNISNCLKMSHPFPLPDPDIFQGHVLLESECIRSLLLVGLLLINQQENEQNLTDNARQKILGDTREHLLHQKELGKQAFRSGGRDEIAVSRTGTEAKRYDIHRRSRVRHHRAPAGHLQTSTSERQSVPRVYQSRAG